MGFLLSSFSLQEGSDANIAAPVKENNTVDLTFFIYLAYINEFTNPGSAPIYLLSMTTYEVE